VICLKLYLIPYKVGFVTSPTAILLSQQLLVWVQNPNNFENEVWTDGQI
jgi:hypothetical protein